MMCKNVGYYSHLMFVKVLYVSYLYSVSSEVYGTGCAVKCTLILFILMFKCSNPHFTYFKQILTFPQILG